MPPKLNLKNVAKIAQVTPEFMELLKQIWKDRWSRMNNEIRVQPPQYRKMKAAALAPTMSRLRGLCTNQAALDKELTRLRGLPYERFYMREYKDQLWLVGLTCPVVLTDDVRKWQGPRYFVYFPETVINKGTSAPFHFVPEGYEMTTARHPHHNVAGSFWDENNNYVTPDYSDAKDPLDYTPATCWGSFATIATACISSGDIVDLFRNIGIYLTRWMVKQSSLLTRPFSACHFLVDIGPADAAKEATITTKTNFGPPEPRRTRR